METEQSCRNGRGFVVTDLGYFPPSAPLELQKQEVMGIFLKISSFLLLYNLISFTNITNSCINFLILKYFYLSAKELSSHCLYANLPDA